MAKLWKPQITVDGKRTICKTYAEVKRNMKTLLEESESKVGTVSRSRRGEWGEWFEYWGFNAERKPVITKEGWM